MRDLTAEELALAPEWATHYIVDSGDDSIIYENAFLCWWRGLDNPIDNAVGFGEMENRPITGREFDITQHEWSDNRISFAFDDDGLLVEIDGDFYECAKINKKDGVAIAKALGVTAEDLK